MTAPIINDPDWDWLPIEEGAELVLGDVITWAVGYQFVVATITEADNGNQGTEYTISNTGATVAVKVHHPSETAPEPIRQYQASQYLVTAHPAVGTEFRNLGDESMWVFQQSKTYRCWQAGALYPVGTVLTRPYITGALVAL